MSSARIDLLWEIGGGALLVLTLGLVLRALFADRSKGRRRCPSCWYDMAGVAALCCPECGKVARSERHLYRTRRHWRSFAAAVALSVLGIGIPAAILGGLNAWRFAPGWVLVRAGEAEITLQHGRRNVDAELSRRMKADELSDAQWGVLINRSLDRTDEFANDMLYTRAAWPADTPIVVGGMTDPNHLFSGCKGLYDSATLKVRLLTTRDGKPGEWIDCKDRILIDPFPIGIPPAGVRSIDVEVKMCVKPDRVLWHGVRTLPVLVSGAAVDVLKPVASAAVDAAVRTYLSPGINFSSESRPPRPRLGEVVVNDRTQREQFIGRYIAIGLRARVLRDGREVARCQFSAQPPLLGGHCGNEPTTCAITGGWTETGSNDEILASTWEVECTGDQSLAFCDYDWWGTQKISYGGRDDVRYREPTEYWAGSFRVTVRPKLSPN